MKIRYFAPRCKQDYIFASYSVYSCTVRWSKCHIIYRGEGVTYQTTESRLHSDAAGYVLDYVIKLADLMHGQLKSLASAWPPQALSWHVCLWQIWLGRGEAEVLLRTTLWVQLFAF